MRQEKVLDVLAAITWEQKIEVEVVLGPFAPALPRLRERMLSLPLQCSISIGVDDMWQRMASADLCIGAGGVSAWERCVLGVPTILVLIADNQQKVCRALHEAGAAVFVGSPDSPLFSLELSDGIQRLSDPSTLREMSDAAAQICDGAGSSRVVRAMEAPSIKLRKAGPDDAEAIWRWRKAIERKDFLVSGEVPELVDHLKWFEAALADDSRYLFIACAEDQAIGHLRLDTEERNCAWSRSCLLLK